MHIVDIRRRSIDGTVELSARIDASGSPEDTRLWFRFPGDYSQSVCEDGNPFLAAMLLSAMRQGTPLRIEAPVCPRLLASVEQVMERFHRWDGRFKPVEIEAPERTPAGPSGSPGVASFFSGGVDSFYTALKHLREDDPFPQISHLLFVRGFDFDLANEALYRRVAERLTAATQELGIPLIAAASNAPLVTRRWVRWEWAHGGALAAAALCLSPLLRVAYIPASHLLSDDVPWGSHPLIDPLWSTDSLSIINDGAEATRVQKIDREIRHSNAALKHLRVCNKNPDNAYNCGLCEKCVRTMINLYAVGCLDACESFERELDPARVSEFVVRDASTAAFFAANLKAIRGTEDRLQLGPSLAASLKGWKFRAAVQPWRSRAKKVGRLLRTGRMGK